MKIISDKNKTNNCFINTISIGRRFAGGFYLTPKAIANDGLFDVCFVDKISVPTRLKILKMVPKGKHIFHKKVQYYQTENLLLEFNNEVPYHLDGELFFSKTFEINIEKQALNVIYNPRGKHFFK